MSSIMFDFENLALRCFYGTPEVNPESPNPNFNIWKYLVFNSVYRMFYKDKIHEVVLALDSPSWRKIVFPLYKENRKKKKEESKVDWDLFHKVKNEFLEEIRLYLPFKVIGVNRAEADDILGALINHKKTENAIIVSMDTDYIQLCEKCRIYNPLKKEFQKKVNVEQFLLYTSLCGQKKDNIFNVKTPFDWPEWKKKPPMGEKGVDKIIEEGKLDEFLDEVIEYEFKNPETEEEYTATILPRERYNLNRKLIDFNHTPKVMIDKTIETYDNYKCTSTPDMLYDFFKRHGWNEILDNYNNVEGKMLELY